VPPGVPPKVPFGGWGVLEKPLGSFSGCAGDDPPNGPAVGRGVLKISPAGGWALPGGANEPPKEPVEELGGSVPSRDTPEGGRDVLKIPPPGGWAPPGEVSVPPNKPSGILGVPKKPSVGGDVTAGEGGP
jgi:hypothetical protein